MISDAEFTTLYAEWRGLLWSAGRKYLSLLGEEETQAVLNLALVEWVARADPAVPLDQQLSLLRVDEALAAAAQHATPAPSVPRSQGRRYRRGELGEATATAVEACLRPVVVLDEYDAADLVEDDAEIERLLNRDLADFALSQMTRDEQETWRAKVRFDEFSDCFDRVDCDPSDRELGEFFGVSRSTVSRTRATGLASARAALDLVA